MTAKNALARIPELDGLRGVAILSVVVFHYVSQEGSTPAGSVAHILQRIVIMGWSGVDLFFVLSGFLIGGILMNARESTSYYRTFYARRFFRIVPIYYFWITAYVVLVIVGAARIQALSNSGRALPLNFEVYAHYLFLQNIFGVDFPGIAGAWFGHLWSLAVEEQFYLLAPLLIRFVAPKKFRPVLVVLILSVPLLRTLLLVFGTSPSLATILMPCRADSLGIGMLLASFWSADNFIPRMRANSGKLYGGLAALSLLVVFLWVWAPFSSSFAMQTMGFTVLAAFYALLLLLVLTEPQGPVAAVMRARWLRELGKVSYAVYIFHIVVNVACHALLLHKSPRISTPSGAAVTLLAAGITFVVARISWQLVEQPLLRKGHAFKY
jgi:peptidoglycan/LPS O-acetylase OafA/YrhL